MAKKMSDWARIERSRETRLWITQVGVPAMLVGAYILNHPEAKAWCDDKIAKIKNKFSHNKTN